MANGDWLELHGRGLSGMQTRAHPNNCELYYWPVVSQTRTLYFVAQTTFTIENLSVSKRSSVQALGSIPTEDFLFNTRPST